MWVLELVYWELQGRYEQLQVQWVSVEVQEVVLLVECECLMQDGYWQWGLEEELWRFQSEYDRVQLLLVEVFWEWGEFQGECGELWGWLVWLELEWVQLEMQSQQLCEFNQQLDLSVCWLIIQCELLIQLWSVQEEENWQLLIEVQVLSWENREFLECSLESWDYLY